MSKQYLNLAKQIIDESVKLIRDKNKPHYNQLLEERSTYQPEHSAEHSAELNLLEDPKPLENDSSISKKSGPSPLEGLRDVAKKYLNLSKFLLIDGAGFENPLKRFMKVYHDFLREYYTILKHS